MTTTKREHNRVEKHKYCACAYFKNIARYVTYVNQVNNKCLMAMVNNKRKQETRHEKLKRENGAFESCLINVKCSTNEMFSYSLT